MRFFQSTKVILLTAALYFPICGFSSPNPFLNSLSDASQRAEANKIIAKAFSSPMAKLAKDAASGNYKDELTYKIALELGRKENDPQIDISTISATEKPEMVNQRIEVWINASPAKRTFLDDWYGEISKYLRACGSDCLSNLSGSTGYRFPTSELRYVTEKDYITSHVLDCAAAVTSYYKWYDLSSYLAKALEGTDAKRNGLSLFLLGDLQSEEPLWRYQGGHVESCDPMKFNQYITLYGTFNPNLKASMHSYVDGQLMEKTKDPDF